MADKDKIMNTLKRALQNWRTSSLGVGALVYAIADLIVQFHDGSWDSQRLGADIMAILTGLGLFSARDSTVSAKEHCEDRQRITANDIRIDENKVAIEVNKETVARLT